MLNVLKQCVVCGKEYRPYNNKQKCCCVACSQKNDRTYAAKWRQEKQQKKEQARKKDASSLPTIMAELAAYNEAHGTFLSYGKFVQMKERGMLDNGN